MMAIRLLPGLRGLQTAAWGLLVPLLLAGCADLLLSEREQQRLEQVASTPPPAGQPAFHVIGLYRGLPPPWHEPNACATLTDPDCQRQLQHRIVHTVDLRVSDRQHPLILGLSAYDRTHWRLSMAPGVEIERIILSGRYPQSLSGVPSEVAVEVYQGGGADCPDAGTQGDCAGAGFWNTQAPARRYQELVAQPPTSFTGAQEKGWIEIGPDRVGVH